MGRESLVEVLCDTSFLIHLATARIRNVDCFGVEIGRLEFVVPQVARRELERLSKDPAKAARIAATLEFAENLKTVPIYGEFADSVLLKYLRTNRCIIGTMDRKLKRRIKSGGYSVLSFSNNRLVLD